LLISEGESDERVRGKEEEEQDTTIMVRQKVFFIAVRKQRLEQSHPLVENGNWWRNSSCG
jgi:hypothetical protein